jgi:acetyl-CoA carboxylase carboxyltransferase component
MSDHLATLREKRRKALEGGGPKRIEAQHAKGKLTARERLSDPARRGSFQELGAWPPTTTPTSAWTDKRFPGDGVITGFGKIHGRRVAVYAQDFTVLGGSFSEVQSQKISRIQDLALESGIPIDRAQRLRRRPRPGGRPFSLAAYGEVFQRNVQGVRRDPADLA